MQGLISTLEDKYGETTFMDSCWDQGNVECLKELIAAGTDINKQDNNGLDSFDDCCIQLGHVECLKELIAAGADINNGR